MTVLTSSLYIRYPLICFHLTCLILLELLYTHTPTPHTPFTHMCTVHGTLSDLKVVDMYMILSIEAKVGISKVEIHVKIGV